MVSNRRWGLWVLAVANILLAALLLLSWREAQVSKMTETWNDGSHSSVPEIVVSAAPNESGPQVSARGGLPLVAGDRGDESIGPIESLTSIKSEGVVAETAVPEQASWVTPPERCQRWGPLSPTERLAFENSGEPATELVWRQYDEEGETRRQATANFRVYLRAASSREEAYARLKTLKSRGLDSFVMTEPPYRGGISLGIFSSFDAALAFFRSIQEAVPDALVGTVTGRAVHFYVERRDGQNLNPALLAQLQSSSVALNGTRCRE